VAAGRSTAAASTSATAASPAPTPNATWYPPVSAAAGGRPAASRRPVLAAASVDSTATPSAAPTCWVVFTRPEATPASASGTPDIASVIIAGNARPNPPVSGIVGSRYSG
jgi:hypothetical protein